MMSLRRLKLVGICLFWVILSGCGLAQSGQTGSKTLEPVTLQLKWTHQFQFAGYYAALEKGYFKDEGLDVTIQPGGPGINVDEEVLAGRADYGILASELVVKYAQGEPVTVIAPVIQHSIRALMVRKNSGIDSPFDLIGKRVALTMNENPEILAMFESEGIDPKEIDIEAQDKTSEERFLKGEIDSVVGSIANQPYQFALKGVTVTMLRPITYGVDFYGDSLFTSRKKAESNPDQVIRMFRAVQRGWEYAFAHPDEISSLIRSEYAPGKTQEQLLYEARVLTDLTQPELVEIGHNNPGRWRRIADIYAGLGIIAPITSWDGFLFDASRSEVSIWLDRLIPIGGAALLVTALIVLWNLQLQRQVRLRTQELKANGLRLMHEVEERQKAEKDIRRLNEELEEKVLERTRQLEVANAELTAFSYSVSHDLRAPIRHILGYTNILQEDYPDVMSGPAEKYLKRIPSAARQMEVIIETLLSLSRLNQVELVKKNVNLSAMALKILNDLRENDPARKVNISVQDDIFVEGDAQLFEIVLTNLLGNAWKFTSHHDQAHIEFGLQNASHPKVIFIRDDGAGFDPEFAGQLFQPFSRLHAGSEFEGTGIGLATVRRILSRHGSRIWIEGAPEQGCTVYFTAPA